MTRMRKYTFMIFKFLHIQSFENYPLSIQWDNNRKIWQCLNLVLFNLADLDV